AMQAHRSGEQTNASTAGRMPGSVSPRRRALGVPGLPQLEHPGAVAIGLLAERGLAGQPALDHLRAAVVGRGRQLDVAPAVELPTEVGGPEMEVEIRIGEEVAVKPNDLVATADTTAGQDLDGRLRHQLHQPARA